MLLGGKRLGLKLRVQAFEITHHGNVVRIFAMEVILYRPERFQAPNCRNLQLRPRIKHERGLGLGFRGFK